MRVVHSLDDAQTQDGLLINTKLCNLHDCEDNSMSQVQDARALEAGAEGLEEGLEDVGRCLKV